MAIPSLDADFTLMWTVMPAEAGATTRKLHWGISGTTDGQGYVAVGFPARPGVMVGSNAFILQDCDDCAGPEGTGAAAAARWCRLAGPAAPSPPTSQYNAVLLWCPIHTQVPRSRATTWVARRLPACSRLRTSSTPTSPPTAPLTVL